MNHSPACERASDLIAFVYNETTESEKQNFELHLKECRECRAEVASFGVVRESITAWRDEALSGFVSTPLAAQARRKSALAAFRQFFDLSPLWLKGATGFAVVAFCVFAALALFRAPKTIYRNQVASTPPNPNLVYTQQDLDRKVQEALAVQATAKPRETVVTAQLPKPKRVATPNQMAQMAKGRRPLSRAEREQLAAELRLLSAPADDGLNLLGDRINQ
ncbi:MAG TPA: zf-HC2 domain-containing protein [Pyrinomonadaceae bacterium]